MCPLANGECMYTQCEFWSDACMFKLALWKCIGVPEPKKEEPKGAKKSKK